MAFLLFSLMATLFFLVYNLFFFVSENIYFKYFVNGIFFKNKLLSGPSPILFVRAGHLDRSLDLETPSERNIRWSIDLLAIDSFTLTSPCGERQPDIRVHQAMPIPCHLLARVCHGASFRASHITLLAYQRTFMLSATNSPWPPHPAWREPAHTRSITSINHHHNPAHYRCHVPCP